MLKLTFKCVLESCLCGELQNQCWSAMLGLRLGSFCYQSKLCQTRHDATVPLLQARLDDRLLEFFPPQKRNLADFEAYFKVRCHS